MNRTLTLYTLGLPAAYFLTAFFSNFYPGILYFIFISLLFQLICGLVLSFILHDILQKIKTHWREQWIALFTIITTAALPISISIFSWNFPGLFNRFIVSMDLHLLPIFLGTFLFSLPGFHLLVKKFEQKGIYRSINESKVFQYILNNLAGILSAGLFFLAYFLLAQSFNFPDHYTRDQFFEADISDWVKRLTLHPSEKMLAVRAVHPAVMLILHPLVLLISLFLSGDKLQAAYILSATAGAGCVYMIWQIVKKRTGNTTYAIISACLLGASSSHLLFSSMLETYIFSAFVLILFCLLITSNRTSLKSTIPVGILIFGITITNLAQACIIYFLEKIRVKTIFKFIFLTVIITVILNFIQVQIYRNTDPIYDPSKLAKERAYQHNLFDTSWSSVGRIKLVVRTLFLYGNIAPTPFILIEELGSNVPNFRTFQIAGNEFHVAGYKGLPDVTVKLWFAIIGLATILFIINFIKSPQKMLFPLSLILCLVFNFGLHIIYGDDPMLYSPNWVYALVLFVSLSFGKWADNRWLQLGLTVFLGMTIYTNLGLIHQIMEISLPYYGK